VKAHLGSAFLLLVGCSHESLPVAEGLDDTTCGSHPSQTEVSAENVFSELTPDELASSGGPPSEVCAADVIAAELTPVNLFLMVDRSGSMAVNKKWSHATGALRTFLSDPSTHGLRVALRFFSDDEPMAGCTMQGCSLDACAEPLVNVGTLSAARGVGDPQEAQLLAAIDRTFPRSGLGTPIYPALGGALKWAGVHQSEHPTEKTVVVFVTDGEPNGCNQDMSDISALASDAYAAFGVPTYAIGLEGSNEVQMDQIARAGQTERGIFVGSSGNAEQELLTALDAIRGRTMSCDFALPKASGAQSADSSRVNITLSSGASPQGTAAVPLHRVDSEEVCSDAGAAWYYDDPLAPTRIHLCPAACELATEKGREIDVELGCVDTRREPQVAR
jgi:hypothetical protein